MRQKERKREKMINTEMLLQYSNRTSAAAYIGLWLESYRFITRACDVIQICDKFDPDELKMIMRWRKEMQLWLRISVSLDKCWYRLCQLGSVEPTQGQRTQYRSMILH